MLDVHLSDKRIGEPLRAAGHDVVSAEADQGLRRLDDEPLLEYAWPKRRIMVTVNAKDFVPITSRWGKTGKNHAGCILIPPHVGNRNYGAVIAGVRDLVTDTEQSDWKNLVVYISA